VLVYDIATCQTVSYFYTNEMKECVSSLDFKGSTLLTCTGRRHFKNSMNRDDDEGSVDDSYIPSFFTLWDFKIGDKELTK
jgi:hypothetical protein